MADEKEKVATALAEAAAREARKAANKAKRDDERTQREGETKAQMFIRVAGRRTNNALDAIALLRGMSNKATYDYTPEQAGKIIAALTAEVAKVEADFKAGGPARAERGFSI